MDRELVHDRLQPVKDSKIGELAAKFDIVLGRTPDEQSGTKAAARKSNV